ncbi:MAG TPA: hypothetical protein VJH20_01175 [Candidatus Nanoarchaeia archaeon]|nr:hypothetical protein [Candidatus Nanoarchaeia archaeon]
MEQLTEEQQRYLSERGFKVFYGKPKSDEPFPFITLRAPQRFFEQSEITYYQNQFACTGTSGICHPSNRPIDMLVQKIEEIASRNMSLDGKVFDTKPGQPIPIFVMDQAWKEVADILAKKYYIGKEE